MSNASCSIPSLRNNLSVFIVISGFAVARRIPGTMRKRTDSWIPRVVHLKSGVVVDTVKFVFIMVRSAVYETRVSFEIQLCVRYVMNRIEIACKRFCFSVPLIGVS